MYALKTAPGPDIWYLTEDRYRKKVPDVFLSSADEVRDYLSRFTAPSRYRVERYKVNADGTVHRSDIWSTGRKFLDGKLSHNGWPIVDG